MVTFPPDLLGREIELGTVAITEQLLRRYAAAIGDGGAGAGVPLGILLALRGRPQPAPALADGAFAIHGGHKITVHRPLAARVPYRATAHLADVFEKSGRSGALTVVERRTQLHTEAGDPVAAIVEQEIVRWEEPLRRSSTSAPRSGTRAPATPRPDDSPLELATLTIGDVVSAGWSAPDAAGIAAYAGLLEARREPLFTDPAHARQLGFANVIVPGPLQSAALEAVLRRCIHGAAISELSLTFRISVIAGDHLTFSAVVVDERQDALLCDLAIENSAGERTGMGTAMLRTPASADYPDQAD